MKHSFVIVSCYQILIVAFFATSCTNKSDIATSDSASSTNRITKQEDDNIDLDVLSQVHNDELLFMNFWNGMAYSTYKAVYNKEVENNSLIVQTSSYGDVLNPQYVTDTLYVFKFENKPKLPSADVFAKGDILEYKMKISPELEGNIVKGIKLVHYSNILKDIGETLSNKPLTEFELQERENKGKIEAYCSKQIIILFKEKYGNPTTTRGEVYDPIFERPFLLTWNAGNKKIIIEYNGFSDQSVYLTSILYIDQATYANHMNTQSEVKQSILNKAKNDI